MVLTHLCIAPAAVWGWWTDGRVADAEEDTFSLPTTLLLWLLTHVHVFYWLNAGKRKFDGGHQNQGESKRRYQSNWGSQPLAQQPLGAAGVNGDQQWYQDSYQSWS